MGNLLALFSRRGPRAASVLTDPQVTTHVSGATAPPAVRGTSPVRTITPVRPVGRGRNHLAIKAVVDPSTTIAGPMTCRDSVMIDGTVNGDVHVTGTGSMALVREGAHVRGNVTAPIVMVAGTVEGNITARALRIFKTGVVHGHVAADQFGVDPGAVILNDAMVCCPGAWGQSAAAPAGAAA